MNYNTDIKYTFLNRCTKPINTYLIDDDWIKDNNNISRKIKKALGVWAEQKEKYHIYKENDTIGIDLPGFNRGIKNEKDEKEEELDKSDGKNNKKKIELKEIND